MIHVDVIKLSCDMCRKVKMLQSSCGLVLHTDPRLVTPPSLQTSCDGGVAESQEITPQPSSHKKKLSIMAYHAGTAEEPSALVHNISSNIQKLTLLTSELQRAVSLLGTEQDSSQLQQTLQQKQQHGNQLAKETDRLMKAFSALPIGPDQRQRKIQKERLLNDFSAALNSFQRIQRQAADAEREFVARVRASSRVSGGQPEDSFGNMPPFPGDAQVQAQDEAITEEDLRLIQERESSIRQLESDITDINDIFKDLGMMVHEQGDMIDSIEANVESADTHVQNATQQLARAADYQQKSRKKICILMIVLAVAAAVIGLIIWGATKSS
ncbi:syntaxin-7-like [Acanthopagrus latus]|uniref:syntaxin-7-like n=1 Tax=Acanthopagrus latus TaxID=8177 RepID=UPI00187BCB9F|nr:syntaxin-7-like [Acanthopagrus latus]